MNEVTFFLHVTGGRGLMCRGSPGHMLFQSPISLLPSP